MTSPRPARIARYIIYTLFAIVVAVALDVPLYNRVEPAFYGIPFFYWFQVAWIGVTAASTFLAYRLGI